LFQIYQAKKFILQINITYVKKITSKVISMGNFLDKLSVRQMIKEDLDSIVDIDTKVLGETRKDYWVTKIIRQAESRPPDASLVAEIDGKVAGFILGEVSGWEFKVPNNIGWIDTIGIDPDYQNRGIAKVLAIALVTNLRNHGVDTIYTLVNWNDWDLLQFFHAMGFSRGDMINLVLKV